MRKEEKGPINGSDRESAPHILLVESDFLSQEIGKAMLEHCGCRVQCVGNGREALDAFSCQPFDLIFIECRTPELDGCRTAGAIRSMESGNRERSAPGPVPIVAITASRIEGDRERFLLAGIDDALDKPYRMAELQEKLDSWLAIRPTEGDGSLPGRERLSPVLDEEALNTLASLQPQGAKPFLTKLVSVYFESSLKQVKGILDAVADHDAAALQIAAHTLKSSSASLGAVNFGEMCRDLEMMARSGIIDDAVTRVAPLKSEYRRVREALILYLKSL